MRSITSIVMCIALFQIGLGQYTYFNTVNGVEGDDASEVASNCEFLNNSFYIWGGGVIVGDQQNLLREYDVDAGVLNEHWLNFSNSYVFSGSTNSFQRIPNENHFMISSSFYDADGTHGYLMKVNDDLDTLWRKIIDIYPNETYIYTHAWDGDGFILAGEHQVAGVGNGTFIAKVDVEGQYLWHTVLHEPEEGSFRNRFISAVDDGYILSGASGGGLNTEGQIEYYDNLTQELYTLVNNESAISRGVISHHVRSNGEVIVTQPIRVSDYPGSTNPSFAYSKSNLYQLNIDNEVLELLGEYNGGGDWITGGVIKTIESSQDGLVQLGRTFLEINDSLRQFSFVMKLTEDYQVDWYTELSYEICSGCVNELHDIEQAPDGGYVMVGKFNSPEDPYDKTWLVKVDACGDMEWQGCEPVGPDGLWESGSSASLGVLQVYPNPAFDYVRVDTPVGVRGARWQSIQIIDITGKVVKEMSDVERLTSNSEVEIYVSNLSLGLYSVLLISDEQESFTGKFIKE